MEIRQETRASGAAAASVSVRELFREVADVPPEERDRILAERRIPGGLRAEIESLLHYDSASRESLTRRVSGAAEEALRWSAGPVSRRCGPYRLVRLLGSGGMGAVYLAERRDGEIEQKVAIKLLRADADRPVWRERFLRERQLLAYLNHSSIARLLDAGHTDDGRPYLVMEYVDGIPVDDYAAQLDTDAKLALFLRICEGVSHAHRHLIVHRDLKPSNILVDSSGQPKLLDFGIAKLLDVTAGETRTIERLLTPHYASPEQLRGDLQTTATDIYSLGAVLYKLLTGRAPRELCSPTAHSHPPVFDDDSIPPPSRISPRLPSDADHILRKALRQEPDERYASVDAFAADIRALLESRPVQARSGDTWYRARKFLLRQRVAAAAAAIAALSLLLGWNIAKQQRGIARTRSVQVRQLVNKVLALEAVGGGLHGSTKSMREVVAISKASLETLAADADRDQGLALEVGEAYSFLARAHGISPAANSEQHAHAQENLSKANKFLKPVLRANPRNRRALLAAARISHDRMILAENDRRREEAVAEARKAAGYLDSLLELGELSAAESEAASEVFYHIALSYKNLKLAEEGIRSAMRSIEIARPLPNARARLSLALSMLADLLRRTGQLEEALLAIREARANLDNVRFPSEKERRAAWCRVLGREAKILGSGGISLNRHDEAIALLQRVFDLLEEWARSDREDVWSRMLFASVGREFGDTLRQRDPQRALAVYDHSLKRLGEVVNNKAARRGEIEILAGSAYALRSLKRIGPAKERLDTAFRLLEETNDYPAEHVIPHEAAETALRALADHYAETDEPRRAAGIYETLLSRIQVTDPEAKDDLINALALSRIYGPLAPLRIRNGQRDSAEALSTLHLELWRHWDRKLPNNGFVRCQLELARK
jgi:serine/threonine protein kinase